MTSLVAIDIGGTHARFAIAELRDGRRPRLQQAVTLKTAEFASFPTAFETFAKQINGPVPSAASLSLAAQVHSDTVRLTNNPWVIRRSELADELGLTDVLMLNDFGAMAWAVSELRGDEMVHITGPTEPLPDRGIIGVVGPGTGLGVGMLVRTAAGPMVVETEGGHLDFAPLDALEDAVLQRLRQRFLRVSTERLVSGPGLANLVDVLAAMEGAPRKPMTDPELWAAAISGEDRLARVALQRFCMTYGAVVGDIALAQGARAMVLTGSLSGRIARYLQEEDFGLRFCAKGRFQSWMARIPVYLSTHDEPGLLGAAAAYQASMRSR